MRRKGPTRGNNRLIPTCLLAALLAGSLSVPRVSAQSAESYRQRALELSRAKSWDEAIANYRKALDLEPKEALTHYNLLADPSRTFITLGNRKAASAQVSGGSDAVRYFASGGSDLI